MQKKQLKLAPHKTQGILLMAGWKMKAINMIFVDALIINQQILKHLDVLLNRSMIMGVF